MDSYCFRKQEGIQVPVRSIVVAARITVAKNPNADQDKIMYLQHLKDKSVCDIKEIDQYCAQSLILVTVIGDPLIRLSVT